MDRWLRQRLADCLGFPVPDEMIGYVLTLNEPHLLDNYFESLLDVQQPEHRLFLNDLKQRMFNKSPGESASKAPKKNPLLVSASAASKKSNNNNGKENRQQHRAIVDAPKSASAPEDAATATTSSSTATGTKKKTKYVSLYDAQASGRDVVLLKGRHHCDCEAVRHRLINNCMHCGRIVCEQEGSGPCLFCGQLVCREDELSLIDSATKKGDALRRSLLQQQRPKGWEEAIAMRNKLLEFDRTSEKRTTVIDDESDYFRSNSVWLNDEERAKMQRLQAELDAKKHASRLATRVTLDFTGRQVDVVEEDVLSEQFEEQLLREVEEATAINAGIANNLRRAAGERRRAADGDMMADDVHPLLEFPAPIFDESVVGERLATNEQAPRYDGKYNRVQDKELLEIADQRCCMSMHQPYASLLVAGIKRHEGRTWYTSHRGRLWIAATAKPADPEEVRRVEEFYRKLHAAGHGGEEELQFPRVYPSGCLVGSVLVQNCLPREDYEREFPHGESESPYVFVCNGAEALPVRFPVKGEHKIYKLDAAIHLAACKAAVRAAKQRASGAEVPPSIPVQ